MPHTPEPPGPLSRAAMPMRDLATDMARLRGTASSTETRTHGARPRCTACLHEPWQRQRRAALHHEPMGMAVRAGRTGRFELAVEALRCLFVVWFRRTTRGTVSADAGKTRYLDWTLKTRAISDGIGACGGIRGPRLGRRAHGEGSDRRCRRRGRKTGWGATFGATLSQDGATLSQDDVRRVY
jgi:hypothetical protein